ncbi:late competence development ComFB family protein [Anaeroselena agilis]|uniref:Late competence development ComFB family protein n=1 Tax=Anaeroselena agilis TaxID=3063788 RepID=A0ABU3NZU5_9FIRM|nr:late competence development ComFB family protein [Selenomonadales bacterium 4137-cl]
MDLVNYMETLVWQHLPEQLANHEGACNCKRCQYDIAALALNFLPPRYVVTDKGQTLAKIKALDQQFYVDIIAALTNAIILVKSRPHHDRGDE